jgi:D-serine deaminase-like pyridoxal phosphate-dependent protein
MTHSLETPAVLIDLDIVEANIAAAQAHFDALGVKFRPHIKTHKIPRLARMQLREGAQGIAAQKLSEVEVFVAEDFDDILLCFNLLSADKIARLRALTVGRSITVVADNVETVQALSQGFADAGDKLHVLVECDTGMGRAGVQTPQDAADLAYAIHTAPGLHFQGLMTYPAVAGESAVQAFMSEAKALCIAAVGHCDTISSGGTPTMADAAKAPSVTEYRAGTYIYNDRSLVMGGSCTWDQCALTVLATFTSRPTDTRAVLDAGSKSLTSDLFGLQGYGHILEYPLAEITNLSEEHAVVRLPPGTEGPKPGEKIRIVPNHACPVSNLVDRVWFHRSGTLIGPVEVAARGCVV